MEAVKGNAVPPVKTPQLRAEINVSCRNKASFFNHLTEEKKITNRAILYSLHVSRWT
jgi:hypothetical protein